MLDTSVTTAALGAAISFASGISMVLSRTANARLAEKTGALQGSLVNHLVGLPITVILAFAVAAASGTSAAASAGGSFRPWIYFGGALGVVVVMLLNITVPKIPGFQLTLLVFVGQVFTGILLDIVAGSYQTGATLWGGMIIAAGIAVNMILERVIAVSKRHRTAAKNQLLCGVFSILAAVLYHFNQLAERLLKPLVVFFRPLCQILQMVLPLSHTVFLARWRSISIWSMFSLVYHFPL